MNIRPLYSGSSGNSCKIETDSTQIIIEAGVSYKKMVAANGGHLHPDAIFITHSHGDHINSAGVLGRKTGAPIYMLKETYERKEKLFNSCKIEYFEHGDNIQIGDLSVYIFDTRHDRPSVGFIVTEIKTGKRFAYVTDTGALGKVVRLAINECDAFLLETDYDEEELEKTAEYDDVLKDRIRSPFGHLGTQQTLDYVKDNLDLEKVSWILLGHLSAVTNSPELVTGRIKNTIDTKYHSKFYLAPLDVNLTL